MVRIHVLLVLTSLFIIAPNAAHAQSDWMNLSWGMSYQEVIERQPGARAVTEKHNRQGLFYDVFARMENVAVSDVPFRVDLLFDNEIRLTGVVMKAYGPSVSLSHGYTRLLLELTDRHGRPMADRSLPNHPGNYLWKSDASEIRLSYTEMVKGEADIVLAYYQTAIVERHSTVVVRRDTVVVPPPVTRDDVAVEKDTVENVLTPDLADIQAKKANSVTVSGDVMFQVSTNLKPEGMNSIGFGFGMIGFDPRTNWIQYLLNGYIDVGRSSESMATSRLFDGYQVRIKTQTAGLKLGMGVPKTNTVIYGIVETFRIKYDVISGTFIKPSGKDGYKTSVGIGLRYFVNPENGGFTFGVENSELRRLGVSIGYTF